MSLLRTVIGTSAEGKHGGDADNRQGAVEEGNGAAEERPSASSAACSAAAYMVGCGRAAAGLADDIRRMCSFVDLCLNDVFCLRNFTD